MEVFQYLERLTSLLQGVNPLSIVVRIALAMFMGGMLGAERGLRNRPAGFMTYLLVCMGSTMIMLTNQYISILYPQTDPTRLASQVASGVGFLGAGTIIVTRNDEVRGLTTAAGLWLAAGLGLAIGVGFYIGALIGFVFSVFAVLALKKIDIYIKCHARTMEIYLEHNAEFSLCGLSEYAKQYGFDLLEMHRGRVRTLGDELGALTFTIGLGRKINHDAILDSLYQLDGVEYLREIA